MRHGRCSRFSEGPPSMYFTNALTRYITKIILGPKSEYSPLEVAFLISKRRNPLNEHLYIPRDVKIFKSKIQECSFDLEISEEDSKYCLFILNVLLFFLFLYSTYLI